MNIEEDIKNLKEFIYGEEKDNGKIYTLNELEPDNKLVHRKLALVVLSEKIKEIVVSQKYIKRYVMCSSGGILCQLSAWDGSLYKEKIKQGDLIIIDRFRYKKVNDLNVVLINEKCNIEVKENVMSRCREI